MIDLKPTGTGHVECDEHKLECDHCPHVETFESEAEMNMARRDGEWCEGHNNDLFCSADCRADAYDPGVKFED